jgi:hypothetical protein
MALRDAIASFRFDLDVASLKAANKEVDAVIKTLDLGRLSTQLTKAKDGNAALAASFKELGVSFEDTEGKLVPLDEQMRQAVAGLDKLEDSAAKTKLQSQLFGGKVEALKANIGALRPQLDKAAEKLRKFQDEGKKVVPRLEKLRQSVRGLDESLPKFAKKFAGAALILGGVTAGAAKLGQWVAGTAEANAELGRFATAVGVTARELGQWELIAGRAGIPVDTMRGALEEFAKKAGEARAGSKETADAFAKLGVKATDAQGKARSLNDQFSDAVIALGQVEDASKRAFLGDKVFAGAGKDIARIALQGADALARQRGEFDRLYGGGAFDAYIQNSEKATQALARWRESSSALKAGLMATFIPILTRVATVFSRLVGWLARTTQGTEIVRVALGLLAAAAVVAGGAIMVAFAAPIATFLAIVAAIFAIVLIVEDLYQMFSGGESAIGKFIDKMFGVGASKKFVDVITDAFIWLFEKIEDVVNGVKRITGAASDAADAVTGFFGGTTKADLAHSKALNEAIKKDIAAAEERNAKDIDRLLAESDAFKAKADMQWSMRQGNFLTRAPANTSANVTINSSPVINVSGANGNEDEIARKVVEKIEQGRKAELRTVRDEMAGS